MYEEVNIPSRCTVYDVIYNKGIHTSRLRVIRFRIMVKVKVRVRVRLRLRVRFRVRV